MEFKKARKVYPLDGMVIGVLFEDGIFKKYDLEPLAAKWPVFNALRYRKLFESAQVDAGGYGIVWNEDIDIAAEEIYFNGQDWPDAPREDDAVAELVARFVELRKKVKMTQQQVADKTGINQSSIARMENGGRAPQLATILRLFDAVGYDLKPVAK
ncbi:MAG: helix-turn-helix domain-containing protein [Elusimicrobiaceae bacterium]|nr:helix-turn-helix domain-containing protein [Elusimicrobiaceae bacterium]